MTKRAMKPSTLFGGDRWREALLSSGVGQKRGQNDMPHNILLFGHANHKDVLDVRSEAHTFQSLSNSLVESKARTYQGRVGARRRTAARRGGAAYGQFS